MEEKNILKPTGQLNLSGTIVDSFAPEVLRTNGVCLVMGMLFALLGNDSYQFEYLMLRHSGDQIFKEPLVYKDQQKLKLKIVCQDIVQFMDDDLGSVYVQMKDVRTDTSFGIALWNLEYNSRSFSIAYRLIYGLDTRCLNTYINQVYCSLINNYEQLMSKLELPEREAAVQV